MTTRPNKPQRKPMPDPPQIRQLSMEEAPHLYENGVYYPSAAIPGMEPDLPLYHPTIEEAPHLYENGVYYPVTDGMPLPDAETQGGVFRRILATLDLRYADQPRTHVAGNTFIYYDEGASWRKISPDCYVAFDVDSDDIYRINCYRVWLVGKPPDFVLEIASEHTAENDLHPKRELYAIMGIGEYWRYDPTPDSRHYGEKLVGERLGDDGAYHRRPVSPDAEGRPRGYSPTLGLDLVWWENEDLRFYDPITGEWQRNPEEEQAARIAAESRAATAESRADASENRADAAESRAAAAEAEVQALREQLRRLEKE